MDTGALVHQLRYSEWATRRVLEYATRLQPDELHRNLGNSYGSVHGTLIHVFQADAIWFDRLMDVSTGSLAAYAPNPDFAEFERIWLALLERYIAWAQGLAAADWDRVVAYRNIKGESSSQPVWQIVLHVVNHATYHRGQITTMLRQLGHVPIGTDLILYYRSLPMAAAEV